jgi:hypothetical protein
MPMRREEEFRRRGEESVESRERMGEKTEKKDVSLILIDVSVPVMMMNEGAEWRLILENWVVLNLMDVVDDADRKQ